MKPLLTLSALLLFITLHAQVLVGISSGIQMADLANNTQNIFIPIAKPFAYKSAVSTIDYVKGRYFYVKATSSISNPDTLMCVSLVNATIAQYIIPQVGNKYGLIEYADDKVFIHGGTGIGYFDLNTFAYTLLDATFDYNAISMGSSTFDPVHSVYFCRKSGAFINAPDTIHAYNVATHTKAKYLVPASTMAIMEYSIQDNALYCLGFSGMSKYDLNTNTYSLTPVSPKLTSYFVGESTFDPFNNIYMTMAPGIAQAPDTLMCYNLNTHVMTLTFLNYMGNFEYYPGSITMPAPEINIVNFTQHALCVPGGVPVQFTTNILFAASNVFTAQLSDASGSFANPVNIGTLAGNYSGTINATLPNNIAYGTGYRIRVISSNPVAISANNGFDITITPYPVPVATNSPVCEGDTLQVYNHQQPGITCEWRNLNTNNAFTAIAPIPNIGLADGGMYEVTMVSQPGCTVRDTLYIDVKPKPAKPEAVYNNPLCMGDTLFLSVANEQAGAIYEWTGKNNFHAQQAGAWLPSAGFNAGGKYYVHAIMNGCGPETDTIDVVVKPRPPQPLLTGDTILCEDYNLLISIANKQPNTLYEWYGPAGFVDSEDVLNIAAIQLQQGGVYHVYNYMNACRSVDKEVNIIVKPNAHPRFILPYDGCTGEMVQVERREGGNVTWYSMQLGGPDAADSTANHYNLVWNTPGRKDLSITAIADNGCISLPYADTIHIHAPPAGKILHTPWQYVCSMDSLLLYTDSAEGYSYKWMPETQFLNNELPVACAQVFDNAKLWLQVSNRWNCTAGDTIEVTAIPCCEAALPTAFTPNGDGKNDIFRVITEGNHSIKKFIVVNRWGQAMYQSNDERKGWDGTFKGIPQEIGTYFYYLRYECNNGATIEKKGEVTLVR